MAHVRQQLREAVAAAVTGLDTTGNNVFQSRVYELDVSELPCLIVTSDGDEIEYQTIHAPAQQQRVTTVRIEAYARATDDLDDTLDDICKEVEVAVAAMTTFKNIALFGTRIEFDSSGEQPVGKATMLFRTDIYTLSNAPEVLI